MPVHPVIVQGHLLEIMIQSSKLVFKYIDKTQL